MSWTEVLASGAPPSGTLRETYDTSRNHVYLARSNSHTVYKWDGTTLTSFAGPTGLGMDQSYTVDVDVTGDQLFLGGGDGGLESITAQTALPLTGTPSWATVQDHASNYSGNQVRFAYAGGTFLHMSLGVTGARNVALYRRSTWNGALTQIIEVLSTTDSNGNLAGGVPIGTSGYFAAGPKLAGDNTVFAMLSNDPSDTAATVGDTASGLGVPPTDVYEPREFDGHGVFTITDGTGSVVFTVSSTPTVVKKQLLATTAFFQIGPELGGRQYGVHGLTLYERSATTEDFVNASDDVPGAGFTTTLTLSHDRTQIMAWKSTGKAYTRDLPVAGGPTGPWGAKTLAWGGPW